VLPRGPSPGRGAAAGPPPSVARAVDRSIETSPPARAVVASAVAASGATAPRLVRPGVEVGNPETEPEAMSGDPAVGGIPSAKGVEVGRPVMGPERAPAPSVEGAAVAARESTSCAPITTFGAPAAGPPAVGGIAGDRPDEPRESSPVGISGKSVGRLEGLVEDMRSGE